MDARQKQILQIVVSEYIKRAFPISSGFLARRYNLGISPATVRNDLADLSSEGYLKKTYFSSGNIPTNKAYRFFVNSFMQARGGVLSSRRRDHLPIQEMMHSIEELVNFLVRKSELFSMVIDEDLEMALGGVSQLFSQPDFDSPESLKQLAVFMDNLLDRKKEIFETFCGTELGVFIGRENPLFAQQEELAWLVASCENFQNKQLIILLIGPTRMPYEKHVDFLSRLQKILA